MRSHALLLSFIAGLPLISASALSINKASSTASCTAAFVTPAPGQYVCGSSGTLQSPSLIKSGATTSADALGCGALCQASSACTAFGYNAATQECQLYSKSLSKQGFVASTSDTAWQYWNVHCVTCATSSSATSNASSSSSPIDTLLAATKSGKVKTTSTKTTPSPTATNHVRCAQTTFTSNTISYNRYYVGSGKTESPLNRGNDNSANPAITTNLDGSYFNDCQAIQACSTLAASRSFYYYSFDIHFLKSTQQWVCVEYYDPNTDASAFNVTNKDAYVSYGFVNLDF